MARRVIHTLLLLLMLWIGAVSTAQTARAETDATYQTPQTVVNEQLNEWTLSSGMLYWAYRCYGGVEFSWPGFLRRKPVNGTTIRTLSTTTAADCVTFLNMNADAEGLYYYNAAAVGDVVRGIYFRPSGDPYDPPILLYATGSDFPSSGSRLFPAGEWVYWITGTEIRRVNKDGGGGIQIAANTAANPTDILVLGSTLYWLDDAGLRSASVTCDVLPCPVTLLVNDTRGNYLRLVPVTTGLIINRGTRIMWVETNSGDQKIRSLVCSFITPGCSTRTIYTVPEGSPWEIGRFSSHGDLLFFVEGFENQNHRVRRATISIDTDEDATIQELGAGGAGAAFTDNAWVYYYDGDALNSFASPGLKRLPFDTAAITRDLAAAQIEVTQGIQNLNNAAPLAGDKPTFVRAYANHNMGPSANGVEARLHATRGGSPLPGSPLTPLNGTRPLQTGAPIDRTQTTNNWLFQLPGSWDNPGTVEFRLEIDPRQLYDDPNRDNNSLTRAVSFANKAPICQVFVPVRTHAPTASTDLSIFWPMVDMTKRLLPTSDIWAYKQNSDVAELQVCWKGPFPYPCFGPYEIPDDDWKIMASLWIRDQFSDDPDACDDVNARTHYTGLMHPSTSTGGLNGMAGLGFDQLFVHMPPLSAAPLDWRSSSRVATLAHELGHNYDRNHINCGGPADPDLGYPYTNPNSCRIDDRPLDNVATYFGFDLQARQPIPPASGGIRDLMAYGTVRWPSDYTWRAIFNGIDNRTGIAGEILSEEVDTSPTAAQIAAIDLVSSHGTVLITGGITPTLEQGELDYAWVIPPGAASTGMLRKWQRFAAGGIYGQDDNTALAAGLQADAYFVRLIGEGDAVLGEPHEVTLFILEDADNERVAFGATFPAPEATVIRVELLADDTVIATLAPGPAQPQVEVNLPAGGEIIDAGLTVSWTATDANAEDVLKFMVQYSHDSGTSWRTLVSNYAAPAGDETVTISLTNVLDIPASNGPNALIRVLASDGYNTGLDVSAPFTVVNRKPEPYIIAPTDGAVYPVDEAILLNGGGFDVEDGGLPDAALDWTLTGPQGNSALGTGANLNVYGLTTGFYTATLTAEDSEGATDATAAGFQVAPMLIPSGGAPTIDGLCEDSVYANAVQVQLAPYDAESQGTVLLTQTGSSLYACFVGLKQGTFQLPDDNPSAIKSSFAGVRIDPNLSREASAQSDDYGFFIDYDGGIFTYAGDGAGGFDQAGPGGLVGQLFVGAQTWSAELQISLATIGGADHPLGIKVGHYWVDAQGNDYGWPYAAGWNAPNTWAETAVGVKPVITAHTPMSATIPSGDITLVVQGTGFVDGATVRWGNVDLTTAFSATTSLTATVPNGLLATPGTTAITVRNPAGAGLVSNAVSFVLLGPAPVITSLTPPNTGAEGETLTLQVSGENFIPNATVYWNGEARPTLFMNNNRLDVQVPAADLEIAQLVGVTVLNPEPDGQASNTLIFTIDPTNPSNPFIFIPNVQRD
ncbi:MAG: IPT/TIG domain-containing protein [Litorilinea sp.]